MLEARFLGFRFEAATPLIEGVSLAIGPGEVVGLSGRSGCGKSTLGRLLAGQLRARAGTVRIGGQPMAGTGFRPVQYLAQTPVLAMNPRWRIGRILAEAHRPSAALRAELDVPESWDGRFPHELSGGELQRVSLLRSLAPGARYLVADEITSALDPIGQAQIWRSLLRLCRERRIGILAVSHDAALLSHIASRRLAFEDL